MNKSIPNVVRLLVSGARACFRRPEFVSDLITYDVMPPTVGRQLLKAAIGPEGWMLDRIRVCRPIRFGWDSLNTARGMKRVMTLIDVAYILEASTTVIGVEPLGGRENAKLHLGLSNYPASARLLSATEQMGHCPFDRTDVDLGWMMYDTHPSSSFFRAIMTDGAIDVSQSERLLIAN